MTAPATSAEETPGAALPADPADQAGAAIGSPIQREPVTSSNLRSVGYDPATQVLEVEFQGRVLDQAGPVWRYALVPPALYAELRAATSIGSAFAKLIRNQPAKHPAERVTPGGPAPGPAVVVAPGAAAGAADVAKP